MSADAGLRAASLADVRRHHLAVVRGRWLRHGPRSWPQLEREIGPTTATVSTLAGDPPADATSVTTAAVSRRRDVPG